MLYKIITKQELKNMENEQGFTPNYSYQDYVVVRNEETGEIVEEYYVNLEIYKTADEVYQEWLKNKNKPPEPTKIELLEEENKLLKAQIEAINATTSFQEELIVELATIVYA